MGTKKKRKKQPTPLAVFLDSYIGRGDRKRFKTRGALAKAIDMSDSGLSRVLQPPSGGVSINLTIPQCLRLAAVLGFEFAGILRMTGQTDLAELAELSHTRGKPVAKDDHLSTPETELIRRWRQSSALVQDVVFGILDIGEAATRAVNTSPTPSAKRLRTHVNAVANETRRIAPPPTAMPRRFPAGA